MESRRNGPQLSSRHDDDDDEMNAGTIDPRINVAHLNHKFAHFIIIIIIIGDYWTQDSESSMSRS